MNQPSSSDSDSNSDDCSSVKSFLVPNERLRRNSISAEPISSIHIPQIRNIPKSEEEEKQLRKILESCFLFSHLDKNEMQQIVDSCQKQKITEGEILIKQGEQGDCMYIIEAGLLNVFKKEEDDKEEKLVNIMKPGSTVGELAVLYSTPRAATVIAVQDSCLWEIDHHAYTAIVRFSALNKRNMCMEHLKSVKFLENFNKSKLLYLADVVRLVTFKPNETIIKEGDEADGFFIIISGSADVYKKVDNKNIRVCKYNARDYFGELALIKSEKRAASVIAVNECSCMMIDVASFYRLLGDVKDYLAQQAEFYTNFEV